MMGNNPSIDPFFGSDYGTTTPQYAQTVLPASDFIIISNADSFNVSTDTHLKSENGAKIGTTSESHPEFSNAIIGPKVQHIDHVVETKTDVDIVSQGNLCVKRKLPSNGPFGFPVAKRTIQDSLLPHQSSYVGKGSYSTVHVSSDDTVIKKFKPMGDEYISGEWVKEAILMCMFAESGCKNLCEIVSVHTHNSTPKSPHTKPNFGISMQRYTYSLDKLIRPTTPVHPADVKTILWHIINGLSEMRRHCVLHRDLKPANIFVDRNTEGLITNVVIGDFGLSLFNIFPRSDSKIEVQTMWYRAPEIATNVATNTETMDMWSVGVILLELVIGTCGVFPKDNCHELVQVMIEKLGLPTDCPDIMHVLKRAKMTEYADPSKLIDIHNLCISRGFDLECASFIEQCLQWNHSKRLNVCDALLHPYFASVRGDTVVHTPLRLETFIAKINESTAVVDAALFDDKYLAFRPTMIHLTNTIYVNNNLSIYEFSAAVNLFDKLMAKHSIGAEHYGLALVSIIGISTVMTDVLTQKELFIFSKIKKFCCKGLSPSHYCAAVVRKVFTKYTSEDYYTMVINILDVIDFDVCAIPAYAFKQFFPQLKKNSTIVTMIAYLNHLCLTMPSLVRYKSHEVFASYISVLINHTDVLYEFDDPSWASTLAEHVNVSIVEEIRVNHFLIVDNMTHANNVQFLRYDRDTVRQLFTI
jgi:serine/threonine protein kinase